MHSRSWRTKSRRSGIVKLPIHYQLAIYPKSHRSTFTRAQAVKQISGTFKSYTTVPRIMQLWKRVQHITGELRTQLDGEFEALSVSIIS